MKPRPGLHRRHDGWCMLLSVVAREHQVSRRHCSVGVEMGMGGGIWRREQIYLHFTAMITASTDARAGRARFTIVKCMRCLGPSS